MQSLGPLGMLTLANRQALSAPETELDFEQVRVS